MYQNAPLNLPKMQWLLWKGFWNFVNNANPPPFHNLKSNFTCDYFHPLPLKINYTMEMVVFRSKGDLKGCGLIFRFMMYLRWISSAIIVREMKNFNWFQRDFGFCNSSEYVQLLSLYHCKIIFHNSSKINSQLKHIIFSGHFTSIAS